MTYARARLWLGIYAVGTVVTLSTLALAARAPGALPAGGGAGSLLGLAVLVPALLFPFDVLGGYVLPWEYMRSRENWASFLGRWLRAATLHAVGMAAALGWLYLGARFGGSPGSVLAAFLGTQVLLLAQGPIARAVGGLRVDDSDLGDASAALAGWGLRVDQPVAFYRATDASFSGGWLGLPGREHLVLPAAWRELPAGDLAVQVARRLGVLRTGSRARGVRLAQAWVVGGWAFSLWATGADATTGSGLLAAWLVVQLWAFLGLLVLPTPSRAGVLEADAYAIAQGVEPRHLLRVAGKLDLSQEDEPVRAPHVETVFHPVPSLGTRQARIESFLPPPRGAWQAARVALFLSWATGGVLARAVHCNLGRPELWVMLPGD